MTPATVLRKGERMDIAYDLFEGPLGRTLIAATPLGICSLEMGGSDRALVASLRRRFGRATIRRSPELLRFARTRLRAAFSPEGALLPLDVRATAFQARVWATLRAIPAGQTRSYRDVARLVGRPRAVRAVARAVASNPVAILVPCHRVIGSDGELHGYRWGLKRKRRALALERR
jgi:AraC family transcriptional regulator of adaptative response/methylated-DNA-[protein]-cysteine methyltransferase